MIRNISFSKKRRRVFRNVLCFIAQFSLVANVTTAGLLAATPAHAEDGQDGALLLQSPVHATQDVAPAPEPVVTVPPVVTPGPSDAGSGTQQIDSVDPVLTLSVAAPTTVVAGTGLTYTLTYGNVAGTLDATNTTIVAPLPTNTTFVSATNGGSLVASNVQWTIGTVTAGALPQTVSMVVSVRSPLANGTVIALTAPTIASTETGTVNGTDTTTTVSSAPVLNVTSTDTPDPVAPNAQLTYTLAYTNAGNENASSVAITSTVPANTTFSGATADGTSTNGTVSWSLGSLNAGSSGSVQFTVVVNSPLAQGTVITLAPPTITSLETGAVLGTGTGTTVTSLSTVAVTSSDTPDPVAPGSPVAYTLAWSVAGTAPVTDMLMTETLSSSLTFVSASNNGSFSGSGSGGTITWILGNHNPGETGTVTFTAKAANLVANGTVLSSSAALAAKDIATVSVPQTTTITAAPIVSVETSVNLQFVNPGDIVTYTVTVKNTGNDTAKNVVLTDTLPSELHFNDVAGAVKSFMLGDIAPGNNVVQVFQAEVTHTATAGMFQNVATASADNHIAVTSTTNLDVRIPIVAAAEIVVSPALSVKKTPVHAVLNVGDRLQYTITVKNTGTGAATDVRISDALPDGVAFADTGSAKRVWVVGTLDAGTTKKIVYTAKVLADATAGTHANSLVLTSENHATLAFGTDVAIHTPKVLGATTTLPATGAGILDLSPIAIGILMIVVGLAGIFLVSRLMRVQERDPMHINFLSRI